MSSGTRDRSQKIGESYNVDELPPYDAKEVSAYAADDNHIPANTNANGNQDRALADIAPSNVDGLVVYRR